MTEDSAIITRRNALILLAVTAGGLAAFRRGFAAPAFMPAIAFDEGGRDDRSFNAMAVAGADRFKAETGIDYLSGQASTPEARAAALRELAKRGASVIVAVGYSYADAVAQVAREFPDHAFTLIDAAVDGANIESVTIREQEGSFLVGVLAGMATKTGKIGFIGGIDVPLIHKFAAGYKLGALRSRPNTQLIEDVVGTDSSAWHNPERAAELADSQLKRGADVIYAAAGASGLGVYRAAQAAGKLAIGVDTNQNGLFPGTMLTSMVKHIDVVVYRAFKSAQADTWSAGQISLGLANGAVGWALDENNRALVTPAMEKRVNAVAQDIIAGRIQVSDYTQR
jgi:basic membrane protein A